MKTSYNLKFSTVSIHSYLILYGYHTHTQIDIIICISVFFLNYPLCSTMRISKIMVPRYQDIPFWLENIFCYHFASFLWFWSLTDRYCNHVITSCGNMLKNLSTTRVLYENQFYLIGKSVSVSKIKKKNVIRN